MRAMRSGPFRFLPGRGVCCVLLLAAFCFGVVAPAGTGNAADRPLRVMGIVERVSGTDVSVGGRTYDFQGVPIRSARGGATVDVSTLRGQTVEILFGNRTIVSVTVYRTLPQ